MIYDQQMKPYIGNHYPDTKVLSCVKLEEYTVCWQVGFCWHEYTEGQLYTSLPWQQLLECWHTAQPPS